MIYFIDTNVFIAALRGRAPQVQTRMQQLSPNDIRVPHQVVAELRVGAAKSERREHNDRQVSAILEPFATVWPGSVALEHYVDIRAALERAGTPISEADLWISAIARAAGGTIVTHNTGEFSRVPGLPLEDWLIE